MRIAKVLNNNVVLVTDETGRDVIITGRGLGFGAQPGDPVDEGRIQQTFVPDATHSQEVLTQFLIEIPPEHLMLAGEILHLCLLYTSPSPRD